MSKKDERIEQWAREAKEIVEYNFNHVKNEYYDNDEDEKESDFIKHLDLYVLTWLYGVIDEYAVKYYTKVADIVEDEERTEALNENDYTFYDYMNEEVPNFREQIVGMSYDYTINDFDTSTVDLKELPHLVQYLFVNGKITSDNMNKRIAHDYADWESCKRYNRLLKDCMSYYIDKEAQAVFGKSGLWYDYASVPSAKNVIKNTQRTEIAIKEYNKRKKEKEDKKALIDRYVSKLKQQSMEDNLEDGEREDITKMVDMLNKMKVNL